MDAAVEGIAPTAELFCGERLNLGNLLLVKVRFDLLVESLKVILVTDALCPDLDQIFFVHQIPLGSRNRFSLTVFICGHDVPPLGLDG
jgi:hypothetical protein